MTFSHANRRLHLYLGLAFQPWFFMYGISSIPFVHNQFFERDRAKGLPTWSLRSEHRVDLPVPHDPSGLRRVGAELLAAAGIADTSRPNFGVYRQSPTQINVYSYTFWKSTQLKYFVDQKKLTVEDRRFRWDHFVDLVCLAIVGWIATGLYMWWGVAGFSCSPCSSFACPSAAHWRGTRSLTGC